MAWTDFGSNETGPFFNANGKALSYNYSVLNMDVGLIEADFTMTKLRIVMDTRVIVPPYDTTTDNIRVFLEHTDLTTYENLNDLEDVTYNNVIVFNLITPVLSSNIRDGLQIFSIYIVNEYSPATLVSVSADGIGPIFSGQYVWTSHIGCIES